MSEPAVSIVIPCYNRAELVGSAIRSALDQGPQVEVIVIDDGSTDDSWAAITAFPDVRSERTENRGVSSARNRGLHLARGSFIKFLDSDDLLPPGSVKALHGASLSANCKDIVVGVATIDGVQTAGPKYGFSDLIAEGPIPGSLLLRRPMPCGLPLFPRQALLEAGGFDERLTISEDYVLAARLHSLGFRFVQHRLLSYIVRDHAGPRLTRHYGRDGYRAQLDAFEAALGVLGQITEEERRSIGQAVWVLGRDASREGFASEAKSLFDFARSLDTHDVEVASWPLKGLYRFLDPYRAEWVWAGLKRTLPTRR